nr:formyltransferase family protein [Pseudoalteromonas sp. McH1-7]
MYLRLFNIKEGNVRVGVFCDSKASAVKAAVSLYRQVKSVSVFFFGINNTEIGPELDELGFECKFHSSADGDFNNKCKVWFQENEITSVILFTEKIISEALYDSFKVYNIHPSKLPSYKGLNALKRAYDDNCSVIAATIHRVNHDVDGGDIKAQITHEANLQFNYSMWERVSFIQKVYLTLLWLAYAEKGGDFPSELELDINVLFERFVKEIGYD